MRFVRNEQPDEQTISASMHRLWALHYIQIFNPDTSWGFLPAVDNIFWHLRILARCEPGRAGRSTDGKGS